MAKLVLLFGLFVLPALAMAGPFQIHGSVYCDTCRCGFETEKTTYIAGARVRIECKDRVTLQLKYSVEGVTNSDGLYNILVEDDHEDQICQAVLVDSPQIDCNEADPGRSSSEIILTRYNGAISNVHFANSMGFFKDKALPGCKELVYKLLYSET
ncbi:hypothetical protein K2173_005306 [Erythroxylum novogranatense]|uniref:Uncharacterized protein n=1 Tax=Erythroxylum novogranatense TaxID=1862640 RepID=A0AAV8TU32_9ROSI|nr:hypothetical protein K2173_005306 [Erythroxylum novogranatense]